MFFYLIAAAIIAFWIYKIITSIYYPMDELITIFTFGSMAVIFVAFMSNYFVSNHVYDVANTKTVEIEKVQFREGNSGVILSTVDGKFLVENPSIETSDDVTKIVYENRERSSFWFGLAPVDDKTTLYIKN